MRRDLGWGPDVLDHLLPHRAPFRLVDRVLAFEPSTSLHARKLISTNEPVFAGHFPGFRLWPGVYTLEGLAQATNLFFALEALCTEQPWKDVRRALSSGSPPPWTPQVGGVLASADLRWRTPVHAGDILDYQVSEPTRVLGMHRVQVEAHVGSELAASGTLTVAPKSQP